MDSGNNTKVGVIVAFRHTIVSDTVCSALEQGKRFEAIPSETSLQAIRAASRNASARLLICDLDSEEDLKQVVESLPNIRIITLTTSECLSGLNWAVTNYAQSLLTNSTKATDIVNAALAVTNGYCYIPTNILQQLIASQTKLKTSGNVFGLSTREIEVLSRVMEGKANKTVAHLMNISVRTVETHRQNIYKKTNCSSIDELSKVWDLVGN